MPRTAEFICLKLLLITILFALASASHTCSSEKVCGKLSGLVPFHKDAIHASLVWSSARDQCPKMLIWMRPSEYRPVDYVLPTNASGVFSGFNPIYIDVVQDGFPLGQLDRSGWSRYAPDMQRENTQLIDVCGLQELINTGVFDKDSIAGKISQPHNGLCFADMLATRSHQPGHGNDRSVLQERGLLSWALL